jgi:hypothetical protein
MKLRLLILLSLFALIAACMKDATNVPLVGKWQLTGSFASPGGPLVYTPATNNQYAAFFANGKVETNEFPGCTAYKITGNGMVSLLISNSTTTKSDYFYIIKHDTLTMNYKGCIEGCALVFLKAK